MNRRERKIAAIAVAVAAMGMAAPAAADSRIFSAKSNRPGVTIEKALRNDKELSIVGRGTDATLFRIDNSPNTPVPCANRFVFVTSTGEEIDRAADLCALNWELTLEVKPAAAAVTTPPPAAVTASEPPPPRIIPGVTPAPGTTTPADTPALPPATAATPPATTPAAPAADAPPSGPYTETVTVAADDPNVGIGEVFLGGQPVAITGRQGNSVQIEIVGDPAEGIACERDLGLALVDGRWLVQRVNICLNDWSVVFALANAAPMPPVAAATQPPTAPGVSAPIANPPVWLFSATPENASLIFGIPQTDASDFIASCTPRSGQINVLLPGSSAPVTPGAPVSVTFSAGAFVKTYQGIGSPMSDLTGASHPSLTIPATDALWSAIAGEAFLNIAVAPVPPVALNLKGSAQPTRQLVGACLVPVVAPPPVVAAIPPSAARGIVVEYFCGGGLVLSVTYNGRQQTALMIEPGAPPMVLQWSPRAGAQRYINGAARLVTRNNELRWSRFGGPVLVCHSR